MTEIIGWISGILLAICGIPLAIRSYREKRCDIDGYFSVVGFLEKFSD
jgi:uncharacterized protein with PQ loop repeat